MHGKHLTSQSKSRKVECTVSNPFREHEIPVSPSIVSPPQCQWDRKELLERLEGDQELLRELLSLFRENAMTNLASSRSALTRSDTQELSRSAHTLKGMLRNLSMNAAAEIASALEISAQQELVAESGKLFAQLEDSIEGLLLEVEAHLVEVKA